MRQLTGVNGAIPKDGTACVCKLKNDKLAFLLYEDTKGKAAPIWREIATVPDGDNFKMKMLGTKPMLTSRTFSFHFVKEWQEV